MVRERSAEPAIEVVLLSASAAEPTDHSQATQARLMAGLAEQGIQPVTVSSIAEPDPGRLRTALAEVLAGPEGAASLSPIALLAADLAVHATALGAVLDDPRVRTGALAVRPGSSTDDRHGGSVETDRQLHLGVLRVDGADRAVAAQLMRDLPVDPESPGDVLLDLTRALTDAGIDVRPVPLGGYAWARATSADQVAAAFSAADAVDERTVRLREAARGGDGFYSTFVLRRISWRFTGVAERIGLTPNQVTVISFGLGLVAAGMLAVGDRPWSVAGALLLQFCLVVDCVDGELARYRRRFSRFGAWLDATTDRVKEFAAIGALAVAGARHDEDLWWLVAAAIAVQTFRNLLDLGWSLQRSVATAEKAATEPRIRPEWMASATWLRAPAGEPTAAGALSWARRVGHFPIGERFLVISLGAALWTARGTLVVLLLAGLLSGVYMLAAFVVRSRAARGSGRRIAGLVDAGPILGAVLRQAIGARASRTAAVVPAVVWLAEAGLIWWLAVEVAQARASAGVVLLAVTAIAHYQHAYGVREDVTEAPGGFVIGTDLRLIALALIIVVPSLLLTGDDARSWATSGVWALAVLVGISSTARSLQAWLSPVSPGADDPPDGDDAGDSGDVDVSGGQNDDSIDRMQTVNAVTGTTVPRPAIGGVR
jgi:phosphatidylglycerophosphate synthase